MSLYNRVADILSAVRRFFTAKLQATGYFKSKPVVRDHTTPRPIAPIHIGEVSVGDIYLHVVVQIDFGLRVEEFTPIGGVRKKGDRYTPDLLVIDTLDPTSGKRDTRFVEELGLMPSDRTNLHRVFRATDNARKILHDLVVSQDTNAYIDLIVPTLTTTEELRLSVDGLFESIAEHGETASQAYDRYFDDLEDRENKGKKQ